MSASNAVAYFWLEAVGGGWRVGAEISGVRMCSRRLFGTLQDAAAFLRQCREVRSISRAAWYFPGITGGPAWAASGGGGPVDHTASLPPPEQEKETHTMTIDIVRAALFTPISGGAWGLPLLLQAEPGCGKTSLLKALARDGGVPCRVLSPGTDGEGAFGVVPVPEKGRITYPAPEWLDLFGKGAGMVLVDEVTTAGPMLQASIMGLLTERRIGAARLPNRVRVIGACNPVQTAAGGYELSPPLANRFGHLAWPACSIEHMASVWSAMVEDSFSTDVPAYDADLDRWAAREEEVKKLWPEAFANAVALVSGFLRAQPQMKNVCPDPASGFAAGPWPSDRTWEYAIRAIASSKIHGLSDADESRFVRGFIGDDAFIGFAEFRRHLDLPDVAALLDGEITFKHNPARLDRTAAVITAAATMVASKDSSTARVDAIWGFLPLWTEGARDIAIPAMRQLVAAKKTSKKPGAIKFLADINPLLQVAK